MPFAGYEDFDDCVRDNQDKNDPEGFCAYLHHEATGEWPSEAEGQFMNDKAVYKPIKAKSVEIKEDKEKGLEKITVPISSLNVDRDGDWFTEEGLKNMKDKINNEKVPMFPDHGYGQYHSTDMIGYWKDAEITDDRLLANGYFEPENELANKIKKKLENGLPIGFSVGFTPLDTVKGDRGDGVGYKDIDLLEISAVGIGSNKEAVTSSYAKNLMKRLDNIESKLNNKVQYRCECLDCGNIIETEEHCKDIECPECSGEMRRIERPGIGRNYDKDKENNKEETMTEESKENEEGKQDEGDSPVDDAVAMLSEQYDVSQSDIWDALDNAGITEEKEEEDEEEDEEEESEGKTVIDYEEIKEMVMEALEELQDEQKSKSKPKGRTITTTDAEEEEVSYEDEEKKDKEFKIPFEEK